MTYPIIQFRVQSKQLVENELKYGDCIFGFYADIKSKLRDYNCALQLNLYISDGYNKLNKHPLQVRV